MTAKLLLAGALANIEILVNEALSLDTQSRSKLARLDGNIIAVKSTEPTCFIYITAHEQGFLLSPEIAGDADAEISGTAAALLKILVAHDKNKSIRQNNIILKGDIAIIQDFQNTLMQLNVDWEYQLSKFIGDIPTWFLTEAKNSLNNFFEQSVISLKNDIDEYLHEEKKVLPTRYELENFYHRIDELRLKLDRNQARLAKLQP